MTIQEGLRDFEKFFLGKGSISFAPVKALERDWEFTTSHPALIIFGEIAQDVTRENPLACIRVKTEKGIVKHYLVHASIIRKARLMLGDTSLDLPFSINIISDSVCLVENASLSEKAMINWCKAIKNKTWAGTENIAKVHVGIPKI
jgi:hypothetical protein